ncbi:MAG: FtsK/SpoIIIE domain-containing protein [Psychrobacillus sp.]
MLEILMLLVIGGITSTAFVKKQNLVTNESGKIQRIMSLSGLNVKDGKETLTTRLLRKKQYEWGWEYVYSIPDGRSFDDYQSKFNVLQDGLNNRRKKVSFADLKKLTLDSTIIRQLQEMFNSKLGEQKEIELDWDGTLIIRVYDQPLPKMVNFREGFHFEVPIGLTRDRNTMRYHDFEKIPHMVIGGATRYGKSNTINSIINSLLLTVPDNVYFYFVDLKGGIELCDYENIKQTKSIAYEPEEALETLGSAVAHMRKIQKIVKDSGKKNVHQAGIKDRYFVIVDEVGELNPSEAVDKEEKKLKEQCQKYMSQIARLGAGLGFRLIVATQYPTGDVVNRQIKQNADVKLCFRVQSAVASRVVLDSEGAEKLPQVIGRAIYQTADKREIVQTPFISWETVKENVEKYIVEKEVSYVEDVDGEGREDSITFRKV